MSDSRTSWQPPGPSAREPVFNIAPAVVGLAAVLLAIHAIRIWALSATDDDWVVLAFSFIPAREFASVADLVGVPGGDAARIWTPLTYAFLHADWVHVGVNDLWLVAFGSPLAWRFGTMRFLIFSAVGAIAGAALHLAFYSSDPGPMVGASAAISAHMAGVSRFAFSSGSNLFGARGGAAYRMPAPPLSETIRNPRVLAFVGIWFGVNIIFGFSGAGGLSSGAVAWDAHVGGFVAGLLMFSLFDRPRG